MKKPKEYFILILGILLFPGYAVSQTPAYSDFIPTVFKGSTPVENVYSPALEGNLQGNPATQPVKVYLPPGYDQYPGNAYPVVYLLHGNWGDYNSFYTSYGLLDIMVNSLLSSGSIIPMIIVTPNAWTIYEGSHYTNSYVSGNWEDFIAQDVIRYCENKYRILDQKAYRGLAGFSMGALGTAKIAMKHPSLFNAVGMIGGGSLDLEERHFVIPEDINNMIEAAKINEYRPSDPFGVRSCFAFAVAFAPDSTFEPVMGRLPVDADGVRIDSIWQKWLEHDPKTMLSTYKDSLLKLSAIQMYIGDSDISYAASESFHQSLLDYGIEHGNEIYSGGHYPEPVMDDLLVLFSKELEGVVPTIISSSAYYCEESDTLVVKVDRKAKLYCVPGSIGIEADSILNYPLLASDVLGQEKIEIELSGFEYGKYRVFAVSNDTIISNIPVEFCLVPDKSLPILEVAKDTVCQEDTIIATSTKDGMIYLVHKNTPADLAMITHPLALKGSSEAVADTPVGLSTTDLRVDWYKLYAVDMYGIISEPETITIATDVVEENANSWISIYPNPTKDLVRVHAGAVGSYTLEIKSLNGQTLYRKICTSNQSQIDLSSFQKGIYFITVRSGDYVRTEKIVKL